MDFKKFKKNRGKAKDALQKIKDQKPNYADDRFWNLTRDKADNGEAIIRFLPGMNPEDVPYVLKFRHSFKENGKWFIENCPVTVGRECPSCQHAQPFWDEDTKESKEIAAYFWRKKQYIYNILVVNDVACPANNGKVMLFAAGQKIHDKIMAKINPESKLDKKVWVFDLWEGLNFKIAVKKKGKYLNYDDSQFYAEQIPVAEDDDGIEAIYKQITDLSEFLDPKLYKEYDELAKKFNKIVKGITAPSTKVDEPADTPAAENADEMKFGDDAPTKEKTETPAEEEKSTPPPEEKVEEKTKEQAVEDSTDGDDLGDDDFDFDNMSDDDFSFDD